MKQDNISRCTNVPSTPAATPDGRTSQIAALADSLLEEKLRSGTATSQEILYALKRVDDLEKFRLEKEKLEAEVSVLKSKCKALETSTANEELVNKALKAFGYYSAVTVDEREEDEEDDELDE
jgi:hypothetical protein